MAALVVQDDHAEASWEEETVGAAVGRTAATMAVEVEKGNWETGSGPVEVRREGDEVAVGQVA